MHTTFIHTPQMYYNAIYTYCFYRVHVFSAAPIDVHKNYANFALFQILIRTRWVFKMSFAAIFCFDRIDKTQRPTDDRLGRKLSLANPFFTRLRKSNRAMGDCGLEGDVNIFFWFYNRLTRA